MSKRDNKHTGDEEYQFPSDEFIAVDHQAEGNEQAHTGEHIHHEDDHFAEEPVTNNRGGWRQHTSSMVSSFPLLRNKRLLAAVGIAVTALIIFQIMRHENENKVITVAKPVAVAKPVHTAPRLLSQLGSLQQTEHANAGTIGQLNMDVKSLQTQLQQSTQQRVALTKAMQLMAKDMSQMQKTLHQLTTRPKVKKHGPVPPPLVFHTRVIIPGRAWVKGSNGLTRSIAVGDVVPQYGRVLSINANTGVVRTSSGKLITLGRNDY